jgi:transcriptional regulator with XRE-family HTH domain
MSEAKASKMSEEHLAEAEKLKQIFEDNKSRLGISHRSLAADYEVSQGAISGYLNGYNALNLKFAAFFASKFKVPISAFSNRLAEEADQLRNLLSWDPKIVADSSVDRTMLRIQAQNAVLTLTKLAFADMLLEPDIQAMEAIIERAEERE